MLEYLRLTNVGPAPSMEMALAPRLNLLTGDNGLGKSFLLDCAWWALTQRWPQEANEALTSGHQATPRDRTHPARIGAKLQSSATAVTFTSTYSAAEDRWIGEHSYPVDTGLVIYGHADGGFAVWDPLRNRGGQQSGEHVGPAFVLTANEVWWGRSVLQGVATSTAFGGFGDVEISPGMVRDWVAWIREKSPLADAMAGLLALLSPPDETLVVVRDLQRLDIDDPGLVPALKTAYASAVPIVHASAGVRRIMALAYMLLWSVDAHVTAARSGGETATPHVTMILDEIDAHLHPRWQRSILRSLLRVAETLHPGSELQVITSTHSPLVLASAEPYFDSARDKLFTLSLAQGQVKLTEQAWAKQGDVVNWLVSDAFGLEQARSIEAQQAIEAAEAWMRDAITDLPPQLATAEAIDAELKRVLAGHDDFWPRWVLWQRGIDAP